MRGCVACQSRLRPGWFGRLARRVRIRRMPAPARAQQVQEETSTLGITLHLKDYGRARRGLQKWRRRTWLAGASARRDMARRDWQWARTRRGPTPSIFKYAVRREFKPSNGVEDEQQRKLKLLTSC